MSQYSSREIIVRDNNSRDIRDQRESTIRGMEIVPRTNANSAPSIVLTIEDIHKEDILMRQRIRDEYYEKHYRSCIGRINDLRRTGKKFCIYEVPKEEVLEKNYNFLECIDYVMQKLDSGGWQYQFFPPNVLRISWFNENVEKEKIDAFHRVYAKAMKPEEKVIRAPKIMHFGSVSRRDDQHDIRAELQKQKYEFMAEFEKAKNKSRKKKNADPDQMTHEFRQLMLTRPSDKPRTPHKP